MNKKAEISVIIPVFNTGTILQDTINSVLDQTFENFEIVIINDGSTDPETLKILSSLHDIRIRVIHQVNSGVAIARNRGIEESAGDYIAFLDHDDLFLPEKLMKFKNVMDNDQNIIMVYSPVIPFGENAESALKLKAFSGNIYCPLLRQNRIYSSSCVMVRASDIEKNRIRFDSNCVPCDDWDFNLQCAMRGKIICCDEPVVEYRLHDNGQSRDQQKMYEAGIRVLKKHWDMIPENAEIIHEPLRKIKQAARFAFAAHWYGLAACCIRKRNYFAGLYCMTIAACKNPVFILNRIRVKFAEKIFRIQ